MAKNKLRLLPVIENVPAGYKMYGHLYQANFKPTIATEQFGLFNDPDHRHTAVAFRKALRRAEMFAKDHNNTCKCNKVMQVVLEI